MSKKKSNDYIVGEDLRLGFERIERLAEEVKALQEDVKDVFNEYKSKGFDVPTMKTVLKLRKMTPDDRTHTLSMVELYMAAIGMGDGSLSDIARGFIAERHRSADEPKEETGDAELDDIVSSYSPGFVDNLANALGGGAAVPKENGDHGAEAAPAPAPLTVEDAARLGTDAMRSGKPVTANPFPPRDPRRVAWDEAWCNAGGTDGMDIPEFLMSDSAIEAKRKREAKRVEDKADAARAEVAKKAEILADADKALEAARSAVVRNQNGSTAWLQSHLGIGYNVAARCMEAMEAEGLVSAPDLKGKRDVLAPAPEDDDV